MFHRTLRNSLIATTALLVSSTLQAESSVLNHYQQQAKALLSKLQQQSSETIEQDAAAMVAASLPILSQFRSRYPECGDYLDALQQASSALPDMPLERIETGYHADAELPPLTNAACYHAKDLLVHPATVQAMAKKGINTDKQWQSAEHEIEEVIEHFSQVEMAMKEVAMAE